MKDMGKIMATLKKKSWRRSRLFKGKQNHQRNLKVMMKYPKEYLEEIKLRLKVSQVVGKYVNLKKRGKEFVGLSPLK